MTSSFFHRPVMTAEVIEWLRIFDNGCYFDGTVGGGGHSKIVLERSSPNGKLIGFDKDPAAIEQARLELASFDNRIELVNLPFSRIAEFARKNNVTGFDGVLLDLGVSSFQLERGERGFSFRGEGPLDMRMGLEGDSLFAKLSKVGLDSLINVIRDYGEEREARRIAKAIIRARDEGELTDTISLALIIERAIPFRRGKIHPATKTFQALRIWVNDELGELRSFLEVTPCLLLNRARLIIISYHSLEDRIVKQKFKALANSGDFMLPHKRVIIPSEEEIRENPRARSAKMRVLERTSLEKSCR